MTKSEKNELNKELCGLLGICWHEKIENLNDRSSMILCSCRKFSDWRKRDFDDHCKKSNPNFTTDSGKVQLLKLLKCYPPEIATFYGLVKYWTDNTGALAIAVRDFLRREK